MKKIYQIKRINIRTPTQVNTYFNVKPIFMSMKKFIFKLVDEEASEGWAITDIKLIK